MDVHLTVQEDYNPCIKKASAVEARLRHRAKSSGVVPESVRAIKVACLQAVSLYWSELWWDPREVGRRDDFQLLLNHCTRAILGAVPTTPGVH